MLRRFRAIIVDDERLARRELRSLLEEHSSVVVAGEARNVSEAVELIRLQKPEVIFLDIQMPGESGFDLLEKIQATAKVIFVTAFDSHAIRAFEVNALDYLLKPLNPERLAEAIGRLSVGDKSRPAVLRPLEYEDRVLLESGERTQLRKINSIICINAAGDYSEVLAADGQRLLVLKSLREWEQRLPSKFFMRIHRSALINLEYVERLEHWFNRSYRIHLHKIQEPLVVSRRYASQLKAKFG